MDGKRLGGTEHECRGSPQIPKTEDYE